MSNELQVFKFEEMEVEIFEFEGKVLFNPRDIGEVLGMSDKTVLNHLSSMNDKKKIKLMNSNSPLTGIRNLANRGETFITESGVYDLIFKSRKQEAIEFKDWVTDEVLPQIRQTGGYIPIHHEDSEQDILAKAFLIANKTIDKQKTLIEQQENKIKLIQPKADKFDEFLDAEGYMSGKNLANIIGVGRNTLYKHLRKLGVYTLDNTPYQKYMNKNLFKVVSKVSGNHLNPVTLISSKGADYIMDLLKDKEII